MDEVLARTLEAGTRLDGVDAALVRLESHEGIPTVAAHGLSADGAEAIAGPPDGSRARAIEVSYRYGGRRDDPAGLIAAGSPSRSRTRGAGSVISRCTRGAGSGASRTTMCAGSRS